MTGAREWRMSEPSLWHEALRVANEVIRLQWALKEVERSATQRLDKVESRLEAVEGRLDQAETRMKAGRTGEKLRQAVRLVWPPAWKLGAIAILLSQGFSADEIKSLLMTLLR